MSISIHALLAESDSLSGTDFYRSAIISIHALLAESDIGPRTQCSRHSISIHALLAESDDCGDFQRRNAAISIHALLAESDDKIKVSTAVTTDFYPRSPCGERHSTRYISSQRSRFLSTLSLRRATYEFCGYCRNFDNFYPRSPCGERPQTRHHGSSPADFYPRSPCGERLTSIVLLPLPTRFLSTLSLRRATGGHQKQDGVFRISIHALLAESDPHIRSTSPGRPGISIHALLAESDRQTLLLLQGSAISIHALLAESDPHGVGVAKIDLAFLSTLSLRRATTGTTSTKKLRWISIHALLAESDPLTVADFGKGNISIHALLAESDPRGGGFSIILYPISIHALLAESDYDGLIASANFCRFLSTLSLRRATLC